MRGVGVLGSEAQFGWYLLVLLGFIIYIVTCHEYGDYKL